LKPSDEVDPEKVVKQNSQIREKVKEYRDKIEKHNEITEGIEEVRSELDNAATLLSDSEFISSSNKIERIESRLTELEVIISEHNFAELEGEINNLQHQKKMLLSDLEENAREYLEDEIESIQSELASVKTQVENNSLTDANERVDDIETKISIAREIATQFNFEDLHKEIESLDRDREAVIKDIGTDMNINVAFSTLRSRLDRAETAIGEGDLKQAADHLSRSEAKLKSVKQSFGDSTDAQEQLSKDFDELVQQHEQQYNNLCSELDDRRRETLEEEKESIQSDIETVRTHLSDGRLTNAIEDLSNIETRINSAQETASQHGFSELQNEIKSLSNTYEQFCEAAEILEKHEEVEDLISAQLDETASLIDDGRITHAYETLTNCRVRIRELKELTEEFEESPAENVVDPTELLGVQLESHYSALEEKEREFVETEIHSIQSELKTIEAHIEKGEFEKAREVIEEVDTVDTLAGQNTERHLTDDPDEQFESRFERVRNIIEQSDVGEVFEDQQETIDTLERRHSELTEKIETLRTLSNEIESLQDELEYIDQTIENNKYDTARENLTEFDNQLHKIEAEVTKYETTPLENKIAILKRRREELLEEIEAAQQQDELKTEISSLRPMLDDVRSLIDDGELEQARDNLTDCEQRIQSLQTSAGEFEKLEKELLSLQDQCEEMLHEVTTLLEKKTVPEKIPQEPDISIVYDELADKQQIGSGGNADVSKAIYQTSDDDITVAIKEPRVSGTLHTADVERVLEEAQTWDKLDSHDHIVGVVDYGSEPLPWIAMEYMDGGHLGEYMDIDLEQKIWTAYAVTEGVLHAHRRGVAHLDLKPENILFRTVENGWNIPKVSDWGLSKHLLDHSKSIEGLTIEYAAPEQFDDEYGATDDFTDIYQLGAVFYELFTGEPLHEGQPFTVMDQIKNEAPTPPSDVSEVPPELDEILMTALAKDKNERYSHVVYLRDALKELVEEF
jgi:chromosome segregation ATPase